MSRSSWDFLSPSQQRACVDSGRFSPDGRSRVAGGPPKKDEAMTASAKPTPTPWEYMPPIRGEADAGIRGADGYYVATPTTACPASLTEANGRLIVAAVNSHEQLIEALRAVVGTADSASETGHAEAECGAGNWDVLGPMLRAALARASEHDKEGSR